MTDSGDALTFFTTTAANNWWDPQVLPVIKGNAIVIPASNYTINFQLGKVTFTGSPATPVTATKSHFEMHRLAKANGYSATRSMADLDVTPLQTTAMDREAGLLDFAGTVERLDFGVEDYDPGGGTAKIKDDLTSRSTKAVEIVPRDDQASVIRALVKFFADEVSQEVAGVVGATLSIMGVKLGFASNSVEVGDPTS